MARDVGVRLKLVMRMTSRATITETQVRSFLVGYETGATAWIKNVIAEAPPVAQASLMALSWRLKVDGGAGIWDIYPKPQLMVSVADGITDRQIAVFLRGFHDDAKTRLRALVAAAPPAASAQVVGWHIHSIDLAGDVTTSDEVE